MPRRIEGERLVGYKCEKIGMLSKRDMIRD